MDVDIRLLFVKLQVKSVKQIVMQHERERVQMEYALKSSSKHIKQMERGRGHSLDPHPSDLLREDLVRPPFYPCFRATQPVEHERLRQKRQRRFNQ